jgi:hypothetical protein
VRSFLRSQKAGADKFIRHHLNRDAHDLATQGARLIRLTKDWSLQMKIDARPRTFGLDTDAERERRVEAALDETELDSLISRQSIAWLTVKHALHKLVLHAQADAATGRHCSFMHY